MDIVSLLGSKTMKALEKMGTTADAIRRGLLTIQEIQALKDVLADKKMAWVLEAMEANTRIRPQIADLDWLTFTQEYLSSNANNLKKEASKIVGNIAHLFPDDLKAAIQKLLVNASNGSSVVRWGSAYALGRIIVIPQYANSDLFDVISDLYDQENDCGVKNQYFNGLKKTCKSRQ